MIIEHPTSEEIRTTRVAARLNQTQAGEIVKVSTLTWQRWETPEASLEHRRMPLLSWEQFLLNTATRRIDMNEFR